MDSNTKNIIVKFVELLDKKNLDYKNIQTAPSVSNKESNYENSK